MNSTAASVVLDLANWKKGWKTSEFWVGLVPAVIAILDVFGVHISNSATTHLLVIVWGAVAAVYIAARSWLKSVHIGHVANIGSLLHVLEQDVLHVATENVVSDVTTDVVPPNPPATP